MSVYVESHNSRAPYHARNKTFVRLWVVLAIALIALVVVVMTNMPLVNRFVMMYRQPMAWVVTGLAILQILGVALYAFIYPQNRKSIRNRMVAAFFTVMILPVLFFGFQADVMRAFGQTGIAVQQCFGPASASFKSSTFPSLACLQSWNTPYAVVERRKIAEFGQKECLQQQDEKISQSLESALSSFNAFDSKDKVVAAFRANQIPLETADGQTYFANINTNCLDGAGYDKNAQFKVVVLASFTAGSLVREVTVSSSNASSFNAAFAKNGIAESYRVDYESKRRVASLGQSLSGLLSSKKASGGAARDVKLTNLSLYCQDASGRCETGAKLTGTILNSADFDVRAVSINWGVDKNGRCESTGDTVRTISFGSGDLLRSNEQRSFEVAVDLPSSSVSALQGNVCGMIERVD